METKYPECEKMTAIQDKPRVIGDFLEWLEETKEMTICVLIEGENEQGEYYPIYLETEKLLAEFFKIDLDKVEEEKRQILDETRSKS